METQPPHLLVEVPAHPVKRCGRLLCPGAPKELDASTLLRLVAGFLKGLLAEDLHFDNVTRRSRYWPGMSGLLTCVDRRDVIFNRFALDWKRGFELSGLNIP